MELARRGRERRLNVEKYWQLILSGVGTVGRPASGSASAETGYRWKRWRLPC